MKQNCLPGSAHLGRGRETGRVESSVALARLIGIPVSLFNFKVVFLQVRFSEQREQLAACVFGG